MLYVLYSYLTNSINSLRVTFGYIHAFVFRWGHLLKSVPTHISTSMSASLCRKVGAQLRILQGLSSYIDEHSRMTIFRSFVLSNYCSLVWNFCEAAHTSKMERIPTELWYAFTMMLAPAMKNCLPVPTYQPWNCIVKEKFLWKCSNNMLATFHHILCGTCSQSKRREL